jgi:hypothetical protein
MRGYCAPLSDSAFGTRCLPDDDLDLLESLGQSDTMVTKPE